MIFLSYSFFSHFFSSFFFFLSSLFFFFFSIHLIFFFSGYINAYSLTQTIEEEGGINQFGYETIEAALSSKKYLLIRARGELLLYKYKKLPSFDDLIKNELGKGGGGGRLVSANGLRERVEEWGGIQRFGFERLRLALLDRSYLSVKVGKEGLMFGYVERLSGSGSGSGSSPSSSSSSSSSPSSLPPTSALLDQLIHKSLQNIEGRRYFPPFSLPLSLPPLLISPFSSS